MSPYVRSDRSKRPADPWFEELLALLRSRLADPQAKRSLQLLETLRSAGTIGERDPPSEALKRITSIVRGARGKTGELLRLMTGLDDRTSDAMWDRSDIVGTIAVVMGKDSRTVEMTERERLTPFVAAQLGLTELLPAWAREKLPASAQRGAASRVEPNLRLARSLIERHRLGEARRILRRLLATDEAGASKTEVLLLLAYVAGEKNDLDEADQVLSEALSTFDDPEQRKPLILAVCRQIHRLLNAGRKERARDTLSRALTRFLSDSFLWRRVGIVYWYTESLADAYAALTTAEALGESRLHVLHARGQVLAELKLYEPALADLNEVLASPVFSEAALAYARSSRAYIIGMKGDLAGALDEFAAAETVTPDNAWLHYFRALCYYEHNFMREAADSLRISLLMDSPPLTTKKWERVEAMLSELERSE